LLAWWSDVARDLPWRHTRDPWAVLVSEAMLQQTQVERVVPRWREFLDRFPTVAACAASPPAAVLQAWAGLGYNRRALNLWRAAGAVVEGHGGRFPATLPELLALPGVGPYTARAVLAFALEADVGVLDTNVARVLARRSGRPLRRREAQDGADAAVPVGAGWAWNQAMLDLGATVCRARSPRCGACPVATGCAWLAAGRPAPDPAIGSAGVAGGQSPFAGSDRQGRGRLVAALRRGAVRRAELAAVMGWPDDAPRAARVTAGVVADGLAVERDGLLHLPGVLSGDELHR
jgi:A/G-specific adenine glycosylase